MFNTLCDGSLTNLSLTNLNTVNMSSEFSKEHEIDIRDWDIHDWKNLIGFKNHEAWIKFMLMLEKLAAFYNIMNPVHTFDIFFKSYTKETLENLKEDCGRCVADINCWKIITELADKGYVFAFFTTQRECHDKNHYLMYMIENYITSKGYDGHVGPGWDSEYENVDQDIEYIILNEKW